MYLKKGLYGSLMRPVMESLPSSRSVHYAVLADYACSRKGAHVFFFLKRKIVYGGVVRGSYDHASFYLNGPYSPLGRAARAEVFWDESERYSPDNNPGVFIRDGELRAQPYILQFETSELSGRYVFSDDLYFALGQFSYPLPSNTIQGMSFCPLTPGETSIALDMIKNSNDRIGTHTLLDIQPSGNETCFRTDLLSYDHFQNEAHIEFTFLADLKPLRHILGAGNYVLCRQVPLGPFKPYNIDRADICLYDSNNLLRGGTVPNIIVELKRDRANFRAYGQVVRYLRWLERVLDNNDEFCQIISFIIAPDFYMRKDIVRENFGLHYEAQIKMYNFSLDEYYYLME